MLRTHNRIHKVREEEEGIVNVDGVKLDAGNSQIVFADDKKDIQVVVSPDPENENSVTVAVLTNSNDEVEDEKVLGSASVESSDAEPAGDGKDEARKAARREAFRKRLEARRANRGFAGAHRTVESRGAVIPRRTVARTVEARQKAVAEARAKFRSKLGKKA